jgi:hypothetical protein
VGICLCFTCLCFWRVKGKIYLIYLLIVYLKTPSVLKTITAVCDREIRREVEMNNPRLCDVIYGIYSGGNE